MAWREWRRPGAASVRPSVLNARYLADVGRTDLTPAMTLRVADCLVSNGGIGSGDDAPARWGPAIRSRYEPNAHLSRRCRGAALTADEGLRGASRVPGYAFVRRYALFGWRGPPSPREPPTRGRPNWTEIGDAVVARGRARSADAISRVWRRPALPCRADGARTCHRHRRRHRPVRPCGAAAAPRSSAVIQRVPPGAAYS